MRYASITDRVAGLGANKWAVHVAARRLAAEGNEIIELTIGEPDVPIADVLLDVCADAMRAGRLRYSSARGEPSIADALSAKYSARSGRKIGRENTLVFAGTQNALFATILALAESGDEVLVGDPLYATYEGIIRASGATPAYVPLRPENGFRMMADDLARAVSPRSRVLLLNTPHNPTGAVLSREDVRAIGEIAIAHDLWIVSDEVYEDFIFNGRFASPFDEPRLAERCVVVSSISKSHAAPGFRSGWAVGPAEFVNRVVPVSEMMMFGTQPFIADMTAHALNHVTETAAAMRETYRRRAEMVARITGAERSLLPMMPDAGMFILLDVHKTGLDGEAFAWRLLHDAGVAVMPGSSFGDHARNFVRISLTVADARLQTAAERIARVAAFAAAEPVAV
ncbi:pyridoxal phosphate-dependent aminotransferase [Acuticoccus kandeliae]|uniref:pyridoxal phosphate-dependent aminotransferase n=1 Tax=Acuticoccus kandeliae TaxID=2073160 RepID=UPI000D3E7FAB|nr:pyridoxal phosphate-dependent aminotransferase [Acuticoccus kandeliae]